MTLDELACAAKKNPALMAELWEAVRRRIALRAQRYAARRASEGTRRFDVDDLTQSGYLALHDAVQRYAPETGAAFSALLALHVRAHFAAAAGRPF